MGAALIVSKVAGKLHLQNAGNQLAAWKWLGFEVCPAEAAMPPRVAEEGQGCRHFGAELGFAYSVDSG
ncbi:hypothetical protein ARSEF4850_002483 [Beauveria asiatica]